MIPYLVSATAVDQRQYLDRCTSSMFQAAIRNTQYKLIYRLDYNVSPLNPIQELYDVTDLNESNNLYLTGLGGGQTLWTECNSMWGSAGVNPLDGCP